MRRLIFVGVVALGLAPGTWVRTQGPLPVEVGRVLKITRLSAPARDIGELRFLAAWELESPNEQFGGYSALVSLGSGHLLAASDRGRLLVLTGLETPRSRAVLDYFGGRDTADKRLVDIEAMTRDPRSGRIWVAYEGSNQIERLESDLELPSVAAPAMMAGWHVNSGPESLVRLADGRFVVLAERGDDWFSAGSPGLVFAGDPVEGAQPNGFRFTRPSGYSPTDMVQLPNGKVMILLRALDWPLPVRFSAKLAVADPDEIEAGGEWHARVVADLVAPLPSDNFEGLAIEPAVQGGAVLWVISDDNMAPAQRTLLLKLYWPDP
jgi:hypothetical protein